MASVEWLADEKEKAAHRAEALRLKLHHAQGDALTQQAPRMLPRTAPAAPRSLP